MSVRLVVHNVNTSISQIFNPFFSASPRPPLRRQIHVPAIITEDFCPGTHPGAGTVAGNNNNNNYNDDDDGNYDALWARSTKNPDVSTGPLAHLFTRPLRSLVHSLAHLAHTLTRGKVDD